MTNPFTITFGQEPEIMIDRGAELDTIKKTFLSERPASQVYMITGVRGSGKTVALTNIYESFSKLDNWVVVELNATDDMLEGLASKLYDIPSLKKLFVKAEINLSAFGIGVTLKGTDPISHIETALERMLSEIHKQGKRVLICVDEAINNNYMKVFTSAYQIFIRHRLPLYLVMTGLYQNIDAIQNDKALTFLYRAPKIYLNRLGLSAMSITYKQALNIDDKESLKLAKLTNGYPFAYQVLGYLCFEKDTTNLKEILPSYDQFLEDYVYQKIYSESSEKEKEIIAAIIKGNNKTKDIRECINMTSGSFSVYRNRLSKRGIIDDSTYGYVYFVLPRFKEIIEKYID